MSIRLKVTLATVLIAALGVGATGVTTFILLTDYFNKRADTNVRQVARKAVETLDSGQPLTLDTFAGTDRLVLAELRSPQGKVLQRVGTSEAADVQIPSDLVSHPGHPRQIEVPGNRGPSFEEIAVPAKGGTVIAVVSIRNEVSTLAHLFRLNHPADLRRHPARVLEDRRAARGAGRQAPGHPQSGGHALLGQAFHRAQVERGHGGGEPGSRRRAVRGDADPIYR